ncbi:MAG: 3,4-dihydroxy-2-butanone-4-phosphate synthase, partial [Acidimicrobiales bacterium]|nr:3,4-dihydroxy-2-butanone-4-phosphate synthase [Acidimicrobiales bacterium]
MTDPRVAVTPPADADEPAKGATTVTAGKGPTDDGPLSDIGTALEAFAQGEILVVVDDEDRENEGDLIMAAEFVTPEKIAFFLHHTSGFICAPITSERAAELDLRPMVEQNTE